MSRSMFRLAVFLLLAFVLGSLLFGSATAGTAAFGVAAFTAVLFLFKILFFFMLLGFIGKLFWHKGGRSHDEWPRGGWYGGPYRRPSDRRTDEEPARSKQDEFDEWHRLAHAKEEVDGWAPEVE